MFGDNFKFHGLQFAYQQGISATMCSWTVLESINYFERNGSEVFGCSMDKSKVFDKFKFSLLFKKLQGSISHVFLRLIIHAYISQYCRVWFNNERSETFYIKNGVGQGKVLAGFTYCLYCYDLFDILEKSGYGLRIKGVYVGVVGFSDDDLLLSRK